MPVPQGTGVVAQQEGAGQLGIAQAQQRLHRGGQQGGAHATSFLPGRDENPRQVWAAEPALDGVGRRWLLPGAGAPVVNDVGRQQRDQNDTDRPVEARRERLEAGRLDQRSVAAAGGLLQTLAGGGQRVVITQRGERLRAVKGAAKQFGPIHDFAGRQWPDVEGLDVGQGVEVEDGTVTLRRGERTAGHRNTRTCRRSFAAHGGIRRSASAVRCSGSGRRPWHDPRFALGFSGQGITKGTRKARGSTPLSWESDRTKESDDETPPSRTKSADRRGFWGG